MSDAINLKFVGGKDQFQIHREGTSTPMFADFSLNKATGAMHWKTMLEVAAPTRGPAPKTGEDSPKAFQMLLALGVALHQTKLFGGDRWVDFGELAGLPDWRGTKTGVCGQTAERWLANDSKGRTTLIERQPGIADDSPSLAKFIEPVSAATFKPELESVPGVDLERDSAVTVARKWLASLGCSESPQQYASTLRNNFANEITLRFYGAPDRQGSLVPYRYSLNGEVFELSQFTRPEWVGLEQRLTRETVKVRFLSGDQAVDPERERLSNELFAQCKKAALTNYQASERPSYQLIGLRWDASAQQFAMDFRSIPFRKARCGGELLVYDEIALRFFELNPPSQRNDQELVREIVDRLTYRKQVLPNAEALLALDRRTCIGGINATVVLERPGGSFEMLISQRPFGWISDNEGLLQTLPRCYHEPLNTKEVRYDATDARPSLTLAREFMEELLGLEKFQDGRELDAVDREELFAFEDELLSEADVYLTSLAFSMATGNYHLNITVILGKELVSKYRARYGRDLWKANEETAGKIQQFPMTEAHLTALLHNCTPWGEYNIGWAEGTLGGVVECVRLLSGKYPGRIPAECVPELAMSHTR